MIDLSQEQQQAVDMGVKALKEKNDFTLGGYAGCGKTTISPHIMKEVPGCMPCAYTGKAAMRLVHKGVPATTIHSLIYRYEKSRKKFVLKPFVDGNWFLIDEASMISTELLEDLCTFDKPFLFIGDPGQLEPIGKNPNVMKHCDFVLQEIHRQGEGSGIIEFADDIRNLRSTKNKEYPGVEIFYGLQPGPGELLKADIVLCGGNDTRRRLNARMRSLKGYKGVLCPGENIIILRNHRDTGLRNGQILTVKRVWTKVEKLNLKSTSFNNVSYILVKAHDPIMEKDYDLKILENMFGATKPPETFFSEIVADYGQVITCHKSQGFEWDNVLVIDEQFSCWNPVRWRYTAATRAAKTLRYYF